jgi:hypothetical protein
MTARAMRINPSIRQAMNTEAKLDDCTNRIFERIKKGCLFITAAACQMVMHHEPGNAFLQNLMHASQLQSTGNKAIFLPF